VGIEIRKVETVAEVVKVMSLEDDIELYIPGSRGEWIQWLVSQIESENDKVAIWFAYKDEELAGYSVVIDAVNLPLAASVFVFYTWSSLGIKDNRKGLELIEQWAKTRGATSVSINTNMPEVFVHYGFRKEEKTVSMIKEIN